MYAFRLEQMGNTDAESTVAPLPATLRKIRASGEEPTWSGFLRADLDQVLTSKDDGRITFRQRRVHSCGSARRPGTKSESKLLQPRLLHPIPHPRLKCCPRFQSIQSTLALGLDSTRAARAPVVGYHSVYSGVKFWSDFYRSNDGHDKLVSAQTGYPLAAIVIFEVEQLLQMMVRETYTRFVQIFAG